jgi:MFS family permease
MSAAPDIASARRGRRAVAAIFLVNGFLVGSWAPQIPVTMLRLEISEFTLGLMILGFGAGALAAMPVCGWLTSRHGARPVLRVLAFACAFALMPVAAAPGVMTAAIALVVLGALVGGTDVVMNANAVEVERRLGRAIMSSSHGFWSLGGFIGGGIGGALIQAQGHLVHAALATALAVAVTIAALPRLMADTRPQAQDRPPFRLPRTPVVYLIGVIALFSMMPEGAVLDWAALYLSQERGADLATAGLGFAFFSGAMAVMRFAGDHVRDRYGAVPTLRVSGAIAAAALLAAGLSTDPLLAVAAFAVCGLGVANMVPIAFSAAGNQEGLAAGAALSTVTVMGYSGLLVAPSAIGFVGEQVGFSPVYLALSGLLLVVVAMAGVARAAEFRVEGAVGHPAE